MTEPPMLPQQLLLFLLLTLSNSSSARCWNSSHCASTLFHNLLFSMQTLPQFPFQPRLPRNVPSKGSTAPSQPQALPLISTLVHSHPAPVPGKLLDV